MGTVQVNVRLDEKTVKDVRSVAPELGFGSVSDFVRAAVREAMIRYHMARLKIAAKRFAARLKAKGVTAADMERAWKLSMGEMPEESERDALEFAEKVMKRSRASRPSLATHGSPSRSR